MASQDNAAVLRAVQMLKAMPGTTKDQQAIYHHLEDPDAVPLTAEQQEILDDYLTPLIYQAEHDFQVVTEGGSAAGKLCTTSGPRSWQNDRPHHGESDPYPHPHQVFLINLLLGKTHPPIPRRTR